MSATRIPLPLGEPLELIPGVWGLSIPMRHSPPHINVYLIEDQDGFVVVDTGHRGELARNLWERFFASAQGQKPIKKIVLTHGHPDHCGESQWLHERTAATVVSSRVEIETIRNLWRGSALNEPDVADFFLKWGTPAHEIANVHLMLRGFRSNTCDMAMPIEYVNEGDVLEIGGRRWKIVFGWGHTPCNTCLYCEKDKIIICGDQVLPEIYPNISIWWGAQTNPLQEYLDSLSELDTLKVSLALPSHGPVFSDFSDRLKKIRQFHERRIEKTLKMCEEPRNAYECISHVLNKRTTGNVIALIIGQMFALLSYLHNRGELERIEKDGIYYFVVR